MNAWDWRVRAWRARLHREGSIERASLHRCFKFDQPEWFLEELVTVARTRRFADSEEIIPRRDDNIEFGPLPNCRGREAEAKTVRQFVIQNNVADALLVLGPHRLRFRKVGRQVLVPVPKGEQGSVQVEQERLAIFDNENCAVATRSRIQVTIHHSCTVLHHRYAFDWPTL